MVNRAFVAHIALYQCKLTNDPQGVTAPLSFPVYNIKTWKSEEGNANLTGMSSGTLEKQMSYMSYSHADSCWYHQGTV